MPYAVVDSTRIFYTDEGDGPGTLLLVHGALCDSQDWSMQIGPFTDRYRVIAPDLRGHGRSEDHPVAHDPDAMATDLAVLLERLGTGPVTVVGHSLGALVASVLAVEHPHLVRAVVAVDPAYGFDEEYAAGVIEGMSGADPLGLAVAVLSGSEGPGSGAPTPRWLSHWHRRRALSATPQVVRDVFIGTLEACHRAAVRPAAEEYLARRSCPVLTVSARASLRAKGLDAEWDKAVSPHPASAAVVLDDVGHWFFQERPEDFDALVLEWLAGLPTAGPVPAVGGGGLG